VSAARTADCGAGPASPPRNRPVAADGRAAVLAAHPGLRVLARGAALLAAVALVITLVVLLALGFVIEFLAFRPLRTGSPLAKLAASLGADVPLLGEFVLVVAGSASDDSPDTVRAQEIYATLAAELDPSKALQLTSTITGISRNELYKLLRT